MRRSMIATLAFALTASVVLAGAGNTVDLSELRDGETRVFGSGEKELIATRTGDTVTLEGAATADRSAISVDCRLGSDNCQVTTFDSNDRIMIQIEKERVCENGVGDCDDDVMVMAGMPGNIPEGAHVIIKKVKCEGDDCEEFEWVSDGKFGEAEMIIADIAGEGGNVFIPDGGDHEVMVFSGSGGGDRILHTDHHGGNGFTFHSMHGEDAEVVDLSELLDGETRIIGMGDKQITAVRSGDNVSLSRPAYDDERPLSLNCNVTSDTCTVVTTDNGENVMIQVHKHRACKDGDADCAMIDVEAIVGHGGPGQNRLLIIEEDSDGEAHEGKRVRKIRVRGDGSH